MKNNGFYWKRKLGAFFHDPVFKAFDVKTHEALAGKFLKVLGDEGVEIQKSGDAPASAMDRLLLPYETSTNKQNRIIVDAADLSEFLHPLSGTPLEVKKTVYDRYRNDARFLSEELVKWVESIVDKYPDDPCKLFHHLWWELPCKVPMIDFLPADTRAPYHSIIDHLDMTAALEGCKIGAQVKPALLQVAIGPIQKFIAAARKTRDLWMGSYILSYLTFQGIRLIGETFGFDHIIFPNMRHQTLLKEWLRKKEIIVDDDTQDLPRDIASLPNKFLAVVPSDQAEAIAQHVKNAIEKVWREIAEKTAEKLRLSDSEKQYWTMQTDLFPEFYYAIQNWENPANFQVVFKKFFSDTDELDGFASELRKLSQLESYPVNSGSFYPFFYELTRRKLEAVKATTAFGGYVDDRPVDGDQLSGEVKAILEDYRRRDGAASPGDKSERLGAINLIKREIIEIQKDIPNKRTPSTTEIAIRNLEEEKRTRWLNLLREENQERENDTTFEKLPTPYYAILVMDGDKMGEWMSGKRAPELKDRLHEKAKKALTDLDNNRKISLSKLKKAAITPSYHRAISRTLDHFSRFVKPVVEDKYNGLLIYAGGDDVLAFLPARTVFNCANDLRKIYSGIGKVELTVDVDGKNKEEYLFDQELCYKKENEKWFPMFPMMGSKATMSAGIALLNHKFPLSDALDIARDAEKCAKRGWIDLPPALSENEKADSRNAFSITVVRHSGQQTKVVSKWERNQTDLLAKAQEIWTLLKQTKVSKKILYTFLEDIDSGEFTTEEWVERYLPYLIERRGNLTKRAKDVVVEKFQEVLSGLVTKNDEIRTRKTFEDFFLLLSMGEFAQREVENR